MQEIIVYRNPVEAAFWHALTDSPELIIFMMIFIISFVVAFLVLSTVLDNVRRKLGRNFGYKRFIGNNTAIIVSLLISLWAAFHFTFV